MKQTELYIGIDVDDKHFTCAVYNKEKEESSILRCRPTIVGLFKILNIYMRRGIKLKVCYEATYIGYSLYRELSRAGIECMVVAPSLIPVQPGKRVKTDRKDAIKLARCYAEGLLTSVHVPDEEDEAVRSLIRSRSFMIGQLKGLKMHLLSLCRLHNINYRQETRYKNYWTKTHIGWIWNRIKDLREELRLNFEILLSNYERMRMVIDEYNSKISEISKKGRYEKKVKILNTFRGLDTLSSMTLLVEIGDVRRFDHPKKLCSYSGLDVIEYSSGGKEKKYGITKMGNKRIRTTLVEASQFSYRSYRISKRLSKAREGVELKYINISDKCMKRLIKKHKIMIENNKNSNKIKVACAREMLCFIWEALMLAA
jgi:transposase